MEGDSGSKQIKTKAESIEIENIHTEIWLFERIN